MHTIKLKIADIIIKMRSRFPIEPLDKEDSLRYRNFIYKADKKPDIIIDVKLVKKLPQMPKTTRRLFLTQHPDSHQTNWALFKNERYYILREYLLGKRQHYILNRDFNKAEAYLLKKKDDKLTWHITKVIYDALQVILIHYLSRRDGIFTHAVGIKDKKDRGFLFIGKSGQGKSTLARLWHKHSRDKVLNDDRIIVRKIRDRFFIYGSPWHGDFSDYLASRADRARLENLFFIYHSQKNQATIFKKGAFKALYPNLFPNFWDREGLEKNIIMCQSLIKNIPCFRLGFKDTKEVIKFVKKINC
jgi:hypothetical protein